MQRYLVAILLGTMLVLAAPVAHAARVSGGFPTTSFTFARPLAPALRTAPLRTAPRHVTRLGHRADRFRHFRRSQDAVIAGLCCVVSDERDDVIREAPPAAAPPASAPAPAPVYVRPSVETTPDGVTIVRGAPLTR